MNAQSVEFREVRSDEEASFLMPGEDESLHLVLFCQKGSPVVEKARELTPRVDIPADWDLVLLDTDGASETARWYGVGETSGMAVIEDGSLLDIEYECSIDALKRLIDVARRQSESLDQLG